MPDSNATTIFPSDIPWRLVAHSILGPVQDAVPAFGVSPSLGVFANVVPRSETRTDFPDHRVVLLKLSPTLTGLNFVFPVAHVLRPYYFPCIGAVLSTRLSFVTPAGEREWPNVQPSHLSQKGVAIRDVYPKHQDYVVNELLGEESLDRQSTRTEATKAWNVSGAASATVGVFSLNIAGGLSQTTVTETAEERAQRQSRQTEIHNIYHLLRNSSRNE